MATTKKEETELEKAQREAEEAKTALNESKTAYTDYVNAGYKPSEAVANAQAQYDAANAKLMNYAPYVNPNAAAMQQALTAIVNRPAFKFSTDGDALYERYKNDYQAAGKKAMEDTMGQAAMLTGGYGNSYAVTAGAQAYNDYIGRMDEIVPQLYQMALDKYSMEGDQLAQKYNVLAADDDRGYARWAGERGFLADLADRAQNTYYNERNWDYGQYQDKGNQFLSLYDIANQTYNNAVAAENTQFDRTWDLAYRAAQMGDYGQLEALGVDLTKYKEDLDYKKKVDEATLAAANGDYTLIDALLGTKLTEKAKYDDDLNKALTTYEYTGDASLLAAVLGVDKSVIDSHMAEQAYLTAVGRSGGGGSGGSGRSGGSAASDTPKAYGYYDLSKDDQKNFETWAQNHQYGKILDRLDELALSGDDYDGVLTTLETQFGADFSAFMLTDDQIADDWELTQKNVGGKVHSIWYNSQGLRWDSTTKQLTDRYGNVIRDFYIADVKPHTLGGGGGGRYTIMEQ